MNYFLKTWATSAFTASLTSWITRAWKELWNSVSRNGVAPTFGGSSDAGFMAGRFLSPSSPWAPGGFELPLLNNKIN